MEHLSIMANHSLTNASAFSAEQNNGTGSHIIPEYQMYIYCIGTILISSFGIWGNGMVIWILGFRIKRNNFTTYVLNLAMADFGLLATLILDAIMRFPWLISFSDDTLSMVGFINLSQFSASQYLLTVISIDRCISVFFPVWHRCHRPTKLSLIVCALIWLLSYLPSAICLILFYTCQPQIYARLLMLIANGLLCLPLIIISSLMIFFKVCCKSKQQRRGKLLKTIMVTVSFFCFLGLPLNIGYMMHCFLDRVLVLYLIVATLCASLNSSVNPFIYYLVGRPRKGRSIKSMKVVYQKLFKEEEI